MWVPSLKSRRTELATKAVTTNRPSTVIPAIMRRITIGALWLTRPGRPSNLAPMPVEANSIATEKMRQTGDVEQGLPEVVTNFEAEYFFPHGECRPPSVTTAPRREKGSPVSVRPVQSSKTLPRHASARQRLPAACRAAFHLAARDVKLPVTRAAIVTGQIRRV